MYKEKIIKTLKDLDILFSAMEKEGVLSKDTVAKIRKDIEIQLVKLMHKKEIKK